MATITYLEHDGTEHVIEVRVGQTLMEGAIKCRVPGIDADCGGACACATCQIYVDDTWQDKIDPPSAMEEAMLDFASSVLPNSRLACQIKVTEALDGLIVSMPEYQH